MEKRRAAPRREDARSPKTPSVPRKPTNKPRTAEAQASVRLGKRDAIGHLQLPGSQALGGPSSGRASIDRRAYETIASAIRWGSG